MVLKCTPDGQVGQEMLDFMKWQASTGVAYITVGDTPVTHDDNSAWLCEMNVNSDDCIHGMHALVEAARDNGAELSVELAYAGRGNRPNADGSPTAVVSAERPVSPELDNLRTMDRADMDYLRDRFVDCAVRCQKAGFRMIMLHCAHNNFLAQWLSPDSNVRTDEYGGTPENRRRYPLEVLKAVREAVGPNMVIELRVSATEDTPGGLELPESLDFMEAAQEYVDIMHVSRGNVFTLAGTYTIPTYFKGRQLNVAFAACTFPCAWWATSPPWRRRRRSSPPARRTSWPWPRAIWPTATWWRSLWPATPTRCAPAPGATCAATLTPTVPPCAAPSTPAWGRPAPSSPLR